MIILNAAKRSGWALIPSIIERVLFDAPPAAADDLL